MKIKETILNSKFVRYVLENNHNFDKNKIETY